MERYKASKVCVLKQCAVLITSPCHFATFLEFCARYGMLSTGCVEFTQQFGTMSYIITSNLLYYHDGDKWVTRDWPTILDRWTTKRRGRVAPA